MIESLIVELNLWRCRRVLAKAWKRIAELDHNIVELKIRIEQNPFDIELKSLLADSEHYRDRLFKAHWLLANQLQIAREIKNDTV